ncbi:hypothetical protein CupriaWKF_12470 [Cupriavidus sp. WKF15]|uniref:hypothetical protein n=1 Tax=Cupriavidus sp. WKF15 TaxID=3032282 RepID=UPI0023E0EFD3|nr:hypothetical protein [Cupriavidus sp. WKF15]WER45122.1 hypothetical protein CupriaWKF_12470 [Cupriavidus sp. WKF15]
MFPTNSPSNTDQAESGGARRSNSLFALGQVVATRGVVAHLTQHLIGPALYLAMHVRGDWGLVPDEDAKANDLAVQNGARVLSAYDIAGVRVWIITEADRSVTTLLLPEEY